MIQRRTIHYCPKAYAIQNGLIHVVVGCSPHCQITVLRPQESGVRRHLYLGYAKRKEGGQQHH